MSKITVVLPTYNEAENLPLMVNALFALNIPNLHIIVVDDESPDGTGELAEDLARSSTARRRTALARPTRMASSAP